MINACLLAHNSREEAIFLKKIWLLFILLVLSTALLAGCAGNADTLASPSPGATGSMMPQVSPNAADGMNGLTPDASAAPTDGTGSGILSLEDAKKASEAMEDAIVKLTEIDDAYVIATGDTAVVGLKFDQQYQGKLDDRIKKMVLTRVQTVDKAVTGVAVTTDAAQVKEIEALAQALESASSLDAVKTQMDELAAQITVYRE